ncbi:MAG: hypothetical protein A2552_11640 [Sulfuricurvum sp. RIFOXYD2_FULL_44_160]|uniref:Lipoprotein n=1 Tax=Sulfuricurvum kujiense TaxID=148813 RepID=A0A2D3WPZ6_9BACT|nr:MULTISPECIES: hypothetical protein [Sulfuricurvum]OHD92025.1 MAG: hypothetical protein A2517_05445 [Sulfuricurvum sp. RIFOXYD12_FULL_44_77]OHD93348.1 MAG: hypothetical protein A2552_11640 [Sulfuricurvum sp. RIFOXYD2_FULL_44_160]DAB39329.1 MAG TPA: hypothetical protein CFH83_01265 [Sulfuricurvum kujiense]
MKKWLIYIALVILGLTAGIFSGCSLKDFGRTIHESVVTKKGPASQFLKEVLYYRSQQQGANEGALYIRYDISDIVSKYFVKGLDRDKVVELIFEYALNGVEYKDNKIIAQYNFGLYRHVECKFFFDSNNKLIGTDGTLIVIVKD